MKDYVRIGDQIMYCPTCMKYNKDEKAVRCGYCNELMNIQNTPFQLPVGTILAGRYYIGRVLGQGGFGITYIGCDLKLNMKMAIKEYYPQGLIGRVSKYDLKLTVNTGNQHTVYEMQKDRFMKEARILAEFASDHTNRKGHGYLRRKQHGLYRDGICRRYHSGKIL